MSTVIPAVKRSEIEKPQQSKLLRFCLNFSSLGKLVRSMSRRDFEGRLARYVNSALGHESEGLAAGSYEYKRLYAMAETDIAHYCSEWSVDRQDLEAQIPAVRKLRNLAEPQSAKPKVTSGQVVAGSIGLIVLLWLFGAATGMFQAGQHFILNHFAR
jgi:hypothetical protein